MRARKRQELWNVGHARAQKDRVHKDAADRFARGDGKGKGRAVVLPHGVQREQLVKREGLAAVAQAGAEFAVLRVGGRKGQPELFGGKRRLDIIAVAVAEDPDRARYALLVDTFAAGKRKGEETAVVCVQKAGGKIFVRGQRDLRKLRKGVERHEHPAAALDKGENFIAGVRAVADKKRDIMRVLGGAHAAKEGAKEEDRRKDASAFHASSPFGSM